MAGEKGEGTVIPIRLKVEQRVAPGEDEVGEGRLPEEDEDEGGEGDERNERAY